MDAQVSNQIELIEENGSNRKFEMIDAKQSPSEEQAETNCKDGVCALVWKPSKK